MPHSVRRSAVLLVLLALGSLALSACASSVWETRADRQRNRQLRVLPGNELSGTEQSAPAWLDPGVYEYKDGRTEYLFRARARSNNTPMGLEDIDLIFGGERLVLSCGNTRSEEQDDEGTRVHVETIECPIERDDLARLSGAPEVRVTFNGRDKERQGFFSDKNRGHIHRFFDLLEHGEPE